MFGADTALALIVSGARNWTDRELIYERLERFEADLGERRLIVIEGTAGGADQIAGAWAKRAKAFSNGRVDHLPMPAEWKFHASGWCPGAWCVAKSFCCAAGFRRNQAMIDKALEVDGDRFVLAFKDNFGKGRSHGTEDLVDRAKSAGIHGLVVHH